MCCALCLHLYYNCWLYTKMVNKQQDCIIIHTNLFGFKYISHNPINLSYSLDEMPPKFFFFAMSQFAHHSKKNEAMEAPQNKRFYFEI
jgi:hypothetical protein